MDANSDVELEFTRRKTLNQITPAIQLALHLANRMFWFGEVNYPKLTEAFNERERAEEEASAWVEEKWGPIEKELRRRGLAVPPSPVSEQTAPERKMPRAPKPDPGLNAPAKDTTRGQGEPAARSFWPAGLFVACVLGVAFVVWRSRRSA